MFLSPNENTIRWDMRRSIHAPDSNRRGGDLALAEAQLGLPECCQLVAEYADNSQ